MEQLLEVMIEPSSEKFNLNDSRWLEQVNELIKDCQRQLGEVRKEIVTQEGAKGGIESIIIALGTSGAITAAVTIIQAWLARDRTRSLKLSIKKDGKIEEYEVTGTGMDAAKVEKFMSQVLRMKDENNG